MADKDHKKHRGDSSTRPATSDSTTQELLSALEAAHAAEDAGDLPGAIRALEAVSEPGREAGIYHYVLGALRARNGELALAVQALERAVQLEPRVPELRGNLGAALLSDVLQRGPERLAEQDSQKLLQRALAELEQAAADHPRLATVYSNLGVARSLAGHHTEGLASFERALDIDPKDVHALYSMASTLHALGDEAACLEALDEALRIDPSFAPAVESRRRALERLGQVVEP